MNKKQNNKEKGSEIMQLIINNVTVSELMLLKKIEQYYNENLILPEEINNDNKLVINAYIAGGGAMSFYDLTRNTLDIDVEIDKRIIIPRIELTQDDMILPNMQKIYIDGNFHPQFGMMSEDYMDNAIPVDIFKYEKDNVVIIKPYIFSPIDMILSKLARWSPNDQNDVRLLIENNFVIKEQLEDEIELALMGYIGNVNMLKFNINECLEMFQNVHPKQDIKSNDKYMIIEYNLDELKQTDIFDENMLDKLFQTNTLSIRPTFESFVKKKKKRSI